MFQRRVVHSDVFKEDIDFRFELNPNRQLEQETNLMLFNLFSQIPFVGQNPEAVRVLAKQTYESLGKKNFDEIWPSQVEAQTQLPFTPGSAPPEEGVASNPELEVL